MRGGGELRRGCYVDGVRHKSADREHNRSTENIFQKFVLAPVRRIAELGSAALRLI